MSGGVENWLLMWKPHTFGVRSVLWVKTNHGTANGQLLGSRNVLELDTADGYTTCEYTQNHRIVHLTWMNFMACLGPGSWKGAGLMGVSSGSGGEGQHLGLEDVRQAPWPQRRQGTC